jgi:hypothetical protein
LASAAVYRLLSDYGTVVIFSVSPYYGSGIVQKGQEDC